MVVQVVTLGRGDGGGTGGDSGVEVMAVVQVMTLG